MKADKFKNGIIFQGDCLEVMDRLIEQNVKVDMILCDLPYGITACKWDNIIPFEPLWEKYNKLIKDNGAIVLFGNEPFSSKLRMSNLKMYKYDWIWKKEKATNFFQLKRRAGKITEDICVFYKKQPTYNPQMVKHDGKLVKNSPKGKHNSILTGINKEILPYEDNGYRYPSEILEFNRVKLGKTLHPTQKPVALLEYLIKTYTNEGEIVLDNCMGSATTCVACQNTNRKFIGIELDDNYYEISKKRLEENENLTNK